LLLFVILSLFLQDYNTKKQYKVEH